MGSTRIRILGPVEIDGAIGGRKERTLLTLLALNANETTSVDEIIDALWPDRPPETARHAVQVYVSKLRKAGLDITAAASGYLLEADETTLDALLFTRLAKQGAEELRRADAAAASATLDDALALWRGEVADLSHDPAVAQLHELRATALEDRFEAQLNLGESERLVPELEAAVARAPYRERLRSQLMLALYRSGRQADALDEFQRTRRALADELGLEPGAELRELQRAILEHDPQLKVEPAELRARRRLPSPPNALIGRRRETNDVVALLRGDARLVTIVGPGGIGKTRLALAAAAELADRFPHGVVFVGLGALRDARFVTEQIAAALELEDVSSLSTALEDRELLLLLDNFEQVDAAAPELGALLATAERLRLLVTSRRPLRIYGEVEYLVPPLTETEAVALFVARAKAAYRRFVQTDDVAPLCERLDRMPLAIELVAARTREVPLATMAAGLRRLELAVGGPRDAPERHRSLRTAIEWSHDLLSRVEQEAFACASVFLGGFTPAAGHAVCECAEQAFYSLAEKSMLSSSPGRLSMLETIREFAGERLEESGRESNVRARHAQYFLELAEQAEPELQASGQATLDRLTLEHDNLRAAMDWLGAAGRPEEELRIAVALRRFWLVRGHAQEARRRLGDALGRATDCPPRLRAVATGAAGQFALAQGDLPRARGLTDESLALFRSLGDQAGVANSLNRLGDIAKGELDLAAAARAYESALAVARGVEDKHPLGAVLTNAGALALMREDVDTGDRLNREALGVWRELGHTEGIAIALLNLGVAAIERQAYSEALSSLHESVDLFRQLGFASRLATVLGNCAVVAARLDHASVAVGLVAAMDELWKATGESDQAHGRKRRHEVVAAAEASLTKKEFEAAYAGGRALSLDEALELGLETLRAAADAELVP